MPSIDPALSLRQLAELSALADGTLDPALRPEVERRLRESESLRARFEQEVRAVAALRAVRSQDRAPAHLRSQIQAERAGRRVGRGRPAGARLSYGTALAGALAAVALAVVLLLPGGAPGSPTVSQAAVVAAGGPAAPAPAIDSTYPSRLDAAVGGLHFPSWSTGAGWRVTGSRLDEVSGRRMVTVYYTVSGHTVAYSILAAPVLPRPPGPGVLRRGYYVQGLRVAGRSVVTWRQSGHTCVLSAAGLPRDVLAGLIGRG